MAYERNGRLPVTTGFASRKADGAGAGALGAYEAPVASGLFDPAREHDACGVGFIVNLKNRKSQQIVQNGLRILENLEHRGAVGADPLMGDGAGIMVQIPHRFFVREGQKLGFSVPAPGRYAVGVIFMPQDAELRAKMDRVVSRVIEDEGQVVLGWRDVPFDNSSLSKAPEIVATEPRHRQVIIGRGDGIADEDAFERKLYIIRKVCSSKIYSAFEGKPNDFYIVSMSCRTLVYKGMFLAFQLAQY
jgi:glutamate synthase (NADPH/NADH) large chain